MAVKKSTKVSYRYQGFNRVIRFFITQKLAEATQKIAVVVEDVAGNQSVPVILTNALDFFPDSPTNFNAVYNPGPKTVTFTWTDPTQADLATIRIFQGSGIDVLAPDYVFEIGNVAAGVETFTTGALADDDYIFGIRAEDSSANLETNVDVVKRVNVPDAAIPYEIGFDSDTQDVGEDEVALTGIPLPDGKVTLDWEYFQDKEAAVVTLFRIYTDNGTGILDFSSSIGSVVRNSDVLNTTHVFTSDTLTEEVKRKFKFVVRAETATGLDDRSVNFIELELFGQKPMSVEQTSSFPVRSINSEDGVLVGSDDDFSFEFESEFA